MKLSLRGRKTKVSIELPCSADEAKQVVNDLMIITNKLSASEVNLLARAVNDPLMKMAALKELKSRLK